MIQVEWPSAAAAATFLSRHLRTDSKSCVFSECSCCMCVGLSESARRQQVQDAGGKVQDVVVAVPDPVDAEAARFPCTSWLGSGADLAVARQNGADPPGDAGRCKLPAGDVFLGATVQPDPECATADEPAGVRAAAVAVYCQKECGLAGGGTEFGADPSVDAQGAVTEELVDGQQGLYAFCHPRGGSAAGPGVKPNCNAR